MMSSRYSNLDSKLSETYTPLKKCYIPARFVLAFLVFWAMSLEFAHRVCLSVTIVVMVNHSVSDSPDVLAEDNSSCPVPLFANKTTDPVKEGDYLWSPSTQGIILGAYFYGFVCTQMLGGRLSEIAGGKWPLGAAIFIGSLLTLITPLASDIGVVAIVFVRVVMGLMHGISLPTAFALFAHWAPDEERSTLLSLCIVGDHLGTVLTMPLAAYLCEEGFAGGWPSVYYVLGTLGCIWFVFWIFFAYNKPSDHPRISQGEIYYIQKGQKQMVHHQKLPIPWRNVLCSSAIWSLVTTFFCSGWGTYTILTKLPTYLELVLHVPMQKNGFVNSLIYICSCITLFLSGYTSDYLRSKKHYNPTKVRKGFQLLAMLGPALCTSLIPSVGCRNNVVILLLALATAFSGMVGGGMIPVPSDMAPHYSATIFGFINGIGCFSGVLSPLVAGLILDGAGASIEKWSYVFYLSAILNIVGGVIFQIFGSAERQPWSDVSDCLDPMLENEEIISSNEQDESQKLRSNFIC